MSRSFLVLVAILALLLPQAALASHEDDAPPIVITSPDIGTTFAYGSIKDRSLTWNKKTQTFTVHITFTDAVQASSGQPQLDSHSFRLPGITFDEAKGIFYATSAKGVLIPVAQIKKTLFIKNVQTTPNAIVRIQYPAGIIKVVLEAISPNDPAMHPPPPPADPDGTQKIDINKVL